VWAANRVTPKTILYIGRSERASVPLRVALEPDGHVVLECSARRTALDLAAQVRPDLVVQELVGTEQDLEIVPALRQLFPAKALPVIGCIAAPGAIAVPSGLFAEVLAAPASAPTLVQTVIRHLGVDTPGASGDATARVLEETRRAKYRSLLQNIPDSLWSTDARGNVIFSGGSLEQVMGFSHEQFQALTHATWLESVHLDDRATVGAAFEGLYARGSAIDLEYRFQHRGHGGWVWLHTRARVVRGWDGSLEVEGLTSDVTERRRLETELRQIQKMEAIGQLAGGIAHDFNNIVGVILANACFIREGMSADDPRTADIREIEEAAERAATLTRQLLAFSRQQVLEQRVIDLNVVVVNMEKMLRRVIGEDIRLVTRLARDLGAIKADVGQIEQVIMNLVVNARDAMPNGGEVTLETSMRDLDEGYAALHPPVVPGAYVLLSVSDKGTGIAPEIQRRIFEPFFTTKERGRGTGLGLSTCYGIIKQSGGYIWVESEVGSGTTFKIYLPFVPDKPETMPSANDKAPAGGTETILVIEDHDGFRHAVKEMLAMQGYRVSEARDGGEAVARASDHPGPIDLILTDVVLPGASGPEVFERIKAGRPEVKVLFMSGYTDHAVLRSGTLPAGASFIHKPFGSAALARKVREALDADPFHPPPPLQPGVDFARMRQGLEGGRARDGRAGVESSSGDERQELSAPGTPPARGRSA
jgi:PAS domain S-box-containing protein